MMKPVTTERPLEMPTPAQPRTEPKVADNIIFATDPREAKALADAKGLKWEEVQWFRSAALLGDADVSESAVHYSAAFTHRQDYAETRDRVKQKRGNGNGR